jgi:hypothetical protein
VVDDHPVDKRRIAAEEVAALPPESEGATA